MMRLLAYTLSMMAVSASYAHAVIVEVDAAWVIASSFVSRDGVEAIDGEVTFDNVSIIRDTRTFTKGSGEASAETDNGSFSNFIQSTASLSVEVGPGAGRAFSSVLNISTFDILFPEPGDYVIQSSVSFIPVPGTELRPDEFAFANYSLFLDVGRNVEETLPIDRSFSFQCPGFLCNPSIGTDGGFIQLGVAVFPIGPELRLSGTATIDFSLSAIAITEPNSLTLVILFFGLILIAPLYKARSSRIGNIFNR